MTDNYSLSDIAAVTDGNRNNGMFGNDWAWIIILLLFGYGNGRGFGGFGGNGGCGVPCATQADVRSAVDQQTLISKLDQQTYGLADSTYDLNNAITNGFFGVQNSLCQGFNGISREIADCCCSTKSAIADVNYNLATQGCAIQNTIQNTTRDVIENANANSRAILDALNANYIRTLESENNSLKLSASQSAQNAVLMAAMDANKAEILRRTGAECPSPAYLVNAPTPVNFPVNSCGQVQFGNGCGCGTF